MARKKNIIAPAAKAMDKMMITREQADKLWGDGQPFDLVRVETRISTNNSTVIEGMVASGRDYLWAKAHVNHGEFMALVDRTANSHTYVLNCMRFADMYSNSAPVPNLGIRKTKALTLLDKPVVEKYLKGGSLGDIPHDDVTEMPVAELEEEVRKLREKIKKVEAVAKEKMRQKDEQITNMEFEIEHGRPLTQKEKTEKAIEAKLEDLRQKLFAAIHQARFYFGDALSIIATARQLEGVTFPILKKWADAEYAELAGFNELFEQLDEELNYISVDKGDGKRK